MNWIKRSAGPFIALFASTSVLCLNWIYFILGASNYGFMLKNGLVQCTFCVVLHCTFGAIEVGYRKGWGQVLLHRYPLRPRYTHGKVLLKGIVAFRIKTS